MTLVVAGGVTLLGLSLLFDELRGARPALATGLSLSTWPAVALVDLWVGVQHVGCGLCEEPPILLLALLAPVVLAGAAIWLALYQAGLQTRKWSTGRASSEDSSSSRRLVPVPRSECSAA